ncbi:MAG: radical SAM protein [Candidatus Woesearchaeota archaeon]
MSITAIIKPTHGCNFVCSYCYIEPEAEKGRMSEKTLSNIVEQVTFVNRLRGTMPSFIWHGGEPLLMKSSFFEKIVELQDPHTSFETNIGRFKHDDKEYVFVNDSVYSANNSIQSNGSLLTKDLAKQLYDLGYHLGTSLDGPCPINNLTRSLKNGEGSFDAIYKGSEIAKEAGIGGGIITVLNKNNVHKVEELYEFYKEKNLSPKVNPLIKSGSAAINYEDLGITPREYGEAMIKFFDLWYNDKDSKINIDPLDEIIGNLYYGTTSSCNFTDNCQENFISIGPQGDVYPCGRFDGIKEFKLGNINDQNLNEMLDSDLRKTLLSRNSDYIDGCNTCEYKPICNSGCMHNAYTHSGNILEKDYYCGAYKMIFKHIEKVMGESNIKRGVEV